MFQDTLDIFYSCVHVENVYFNYDKQFYYTSKNDLKSQERSLSFNWVLTLFHSVLTTVASYQPSQICQHQSKILTMIPFNIKKMFLKLNYNSGMLIFLFPFFHTFSWENIRPVLRSTDEEKKGLQGSSLASYPHLDRSKNMSKSKTKNVKPKGCHA